MNKIMSILIVFALHSAASNTLLAHEREGLANVVPDLLVSLSAEKAEKAVLILRVNQPPPDSSSNGEFDLNMWAVIVSHDGPLPCNGPDPCFSEFKLDVPDSGFVKLVVSVNKHTIPYVGEEYRLVVDGAAAGPVPVGTVVADSLGRVDFLFRPFLKRGVADGLGPPLWNTRLSGFIVDEGGGTKGAIAIPDYQGYIIRAKVPGS